MIEETVGVSVFENKKKTNLAKIEKHDSTLKEIEEMINESILPKLSQLKEEEKSLLEYRNVAAEYEVSNKIYTAYQYLNCKNVVNNSDKIIEEKYNLISDKNAENVQIKQKYVQLSKELKGLQEKLSIEIGGDLNNLEAELNAKKTVLEEINTNKKLKNEMIKQENDKIKNLKKTFEKDKKVLDKKVKDYDSFKDSLEKLKAEHVQMETNMKKAEKDFEAVTLGLSKGRDGEEATTLAQQVMNTKDELASIESNINKSKLVIEHNQVELKQKRQKVKTDMNSYEGATRDIEIKTKELNDIENVLTNIDFNEERFEEVKVKLNRCTRDSHSLTDKLHQLQSEVSGIKFNYTKPYSNFDQSDVVGVVCNLFSINSQEHALAIEKACGGRLYNVIVSNEEVGKALINKGNLKERRTFLPLNKIRGRDTDLKALRVAERLVGKGNVHYAINLVSYDYSLKNAMKHVFGDTMICPNMDMAKKVAFADGVMKRTITYDGEIFDPSGTLTGGSLRGGPQSLMIISEINNVNEELKRLQIIKQQLEEEFNQLNSLSKQYYSNKSKFDLKTREIELLNQRLKETSHYVLMKEIEDMDNLIKQEEQNLKNFNQEKKDILKRIKELENKIKNADATRGREREEAKELLDSSRKQFEASTKKLQKEEQSFECLTQEIKHQEEKIANLESQISQLHTQIELMNKEISEFDDEIEKSTEDVCVAQEKYNEYKEMLNAKSNDIKKMQNSLNSLKSKQDDNDCKIKVIEHEIEKVQLSTKEATSNLKSLLHKYSWIKEEEKYFRSADSEYRVLHDNFNEEVFVTKIASLKSKKTALSKRVNLKANTMHGEKQKEFDDLIQKRDITVKDREKLLRYVDIVDKKKDFSLRQAFEKVNEYFGSIFSTLLPNSNAKLCLVKNNSIKEGIEIKVAFGQVWKESLSELSGGQRSLVALSLVLALLRYSPAPLYILDEIDAALDQSHTQNIGIMIRKHFKNSQVCQSYYLIVY